MSSRERDEAKVTVLLLLNNVVMPMLLRTTGRRLGSARRGNERGTGEGAWIMSSSSPSVNDLIRSRAQRQRSQHISGFTRDTHRLWAWPLITWHGLASRHR